MQNLALLDPMTSTISFLECLEVFLVPLQIIDQEITDYSLWIHIVHDPKAHFNDL